MNEKLPVNWDGYFKNFVNKPLIESLRSRLVKGAYERLLRGITFRKASHFCELGAGTAVMSRFLGEKYDAQIIIVDNNKTALDLSKKSFKNFQKSFQILENDVFELDSLNKKFDLVHSGGLIEHFIGSTRQKIIDIHCNLVSDQGYLLILVPIRNAWYRILNEGIFSYFHLLDEVPEVPWSLQELETVLNQHNFQIIARTSVISELGVLAKRIS